MDSESNYDVTPANHSCKSSSTTINVMQPNSTNSNTSNDIDNTTNQHAKNAQYDNIDNTTVKPMHGGYKKFTIIFINNSYIIDSTDELDAIKFFLKNIVNKIYKKDNLLEIISNKNKSMYIVKAKYKNKFKKIH